MSLLSDTLQIYLNPLQTTFMKYLLLLAFIPLLSSSDCGKKKKKEKTGDSVAIQDSVPVCIRDLIEKRKKMDPPETPEQVDEYLYKGKTVYLITAPCCDMFNDLVDDSCRRICSPTGGIHGRGDMKCDDFNTEAKLVKRIWTNTNQ